MKRGKDHVWQFCKYKGDAAYYANCKCGFRYACYKNEVLGEPKLIPDPNKLYYYCPHCGARKLRYIPEPIYIDRYSWE